MQSERNLTGGIASLCDAPARRLLGSSYFSAGGFEKTVFSETSRGSNMFHVAVTMGLSCGFERNTAGSALPSRG